ncbi:MAG: putative toxin-antitoxin system toxin component, PIN family [Betaproteobacteria bacterium]|nr:putative toxin-antitoxin system toxin component, PIN family [Betaproteobacteria bacterium]
MRIVLDTNTLVSAVLSPTGPPRQLLNAAREASFVLYSSPILIAELLDVLTREKFAGHFAAARLTAWDVVKDIRRIATVVSPEDVPRVITDDPDDDHILACAVASRASLIVSGDKHLLSLGGAYQGIPIMRPTEAVRLLFNKPT